MKTLKHCIGCQLYKKSIYYGVQCLAQYSTDCPCIECIVKPMCTDKRMYCNDWKFFTKHKFYIFNKNIKVKTNGTMQRLP